MKKITLFQIIPFLMLVFSTTFSFSQTVIADVTPYEVDPSTICDVTGCTANDVTIGQVYIADANNVQMTTCSPGDPYSGMYIWVEVTGASSKYDLFLQFELWKNGVQIGLDGNPSNQKISVGANGEIVVADYRMLPLPNGFVCGDELELSNIYISWQTKNNAANADPTCATQQAKCSGANLSAIKVNTPLSVSFTYEEICGTGAYKDVVFTDTTTGGDGTLTYSWNFGGSATPSTATTEGPHTVSFNSASPQVSLTVTDEDGDFATYTQTISLSNSPSITSLTATPIACNGQGTGTVSVSASGFIGSTLTYNLLYSGTSGGTFTNSPNTTGDSTGNYTGLYDGFYKVEISDGQGCSVTSNEIEVTEPPLLTSTTSQTNSCAGGASGSATVFPSGGVSPYSYSWTTTSGTIGSGATTATISGLTTGTYTVTVTDANSCTTTNSVTILQGTSISLTDTHVDVLCNGAATGSIDLSVNGGTAPYTYDWSNGADTQDLSGLVVATYSVTVTDANGCTATASVTITEPSVLVASSVEGSILCNGGTTTVTVSATGGTAPYTGTGEFTVSAGAYSYTVTDANGCESTVTGNISEPAVLVASIETEDNTLLTCSNTSITLYVNSNYEGLTYSWVGPNDFTSQESSIMVTAPGIYEVYVQNENGCEASDEIEISQNIEAPEISLESEGVITCANPSVEVFVNTYEGQGEYSYLWNTGATTSTITVSEPGEYSVVVTNLANGCSSTDSINVYENISQPELEIIGSRVLTCTSLSTTLTAEATYENNYGLNIFNYLWSTGATTASVSLDEPGDYTVTVTNTLNGCSTTEEVTVYLNVTPPTVEIIGDTVLTCDVNSLELTAEATAAYSNNLDIFTYLWSTGATTASVSIDEPGDYTVTVTNTLNGCSSTEEITIYSNITPPTVEIIGDTVLTCDVNSLELTAEATAAYSNNLDIFTYLWSTGATTASVSIDEPGTYSVIVTNTLNGCSSTEEVTVMLNVTQPEVEILGETTLTCSTTSVELTAEATYENNYGLDIFTYLWNTGATTSSIEVGAPGIYEVEVTNTLNGCSVAESIEVTQNTAAPVVTIEGNTLLTCNDTSVEVTAVSSIENVTYLWNTGATTSSIEVGAPGIYEVEVTNTFNGCSVLESIEVTQNIVTPVVTIEGDTALTCDISTVTLTATSSIQGLTYLWSTGETTQSIVVDFEGPYEVTVTDPINGCTSTEVVMVTYDCVPPPPPPALYFDINSGVLDCSNPTLLLEATVYNAVGELSYLWSTGATTATIDVTEPGDYSVVITDSYDGRSGEGYTTVTANFTAPDVQIQGNTELNNEDPTSTILEAVTSIEGATYLWNTGATTSSIVVNWTEAGEYIVTVTDPVNGCSTTESIIVYAEEMQGDVVELVTDVTTGNLSCSNPSVTLDASGSYTSISNANETIIITDNLTFSWSTGETTSSITVTEPGEYIVTITDTFYNASVDITVVVTANFAEPVVEITGSMLTCSNPTATLDAVTQVEGLTYLWNTGATSTSIDVSVAGEYSVIVTDPTNGCSSEAMYIVEENYTNDEVVEGNSIALCIEDGSLDLTALLPIGYVAGGSWSDTMNSGGLNGDFFDPIIVNLGDYEFIYNEPGNCGRQIVVYVNVNDDCVVLPCSTEGTIEVSKVVTANSDGMNDFFTISEIASCGFTASVKIFNRWGKVVYQSENYQNDWNGRHDNSGLTIGSDSTLPTGTYYYVIQINGSGYKPLTGYIYLGTN